MRFIRSIMEDEINLDAVKAVDVHDDTIEPDSDLNAGGVGRSEPAVRGRGMLFAARAMAFIIDSFSISILNLGAQYLGVVVSAIILGALDAVFGLRYDFSSTGAAEPGFIRLILAFIYFVLFEWLYGSTLGKVILMLRAVNYDGRPCNLRQAIIRGVFRYVETIAIIAYLNMTPPLYQRWGDKMAGTLVVGTKDPIIKEPRARRSFFAALIVYFLVAGLIQGLSFDLRFTTITK
jgi:uncharacterized RDD family membrane protein YckC